jgi:hypothetical protein
LFFFQRKCNKIFNCLIFKRIKLFSRPIFNKILFDTHIIHFIDISNMRNPFIILSCTILIPHLVPTHSSGTNTNIWFQHSHPVLNYSSKYWYASKAKLGTWVLSRATSTWRHLC